MEKSYFPPFQRMGVGSSTVEQRPFKSLVRGSNPRQPTSVKMILDFRLRIVDCVCICNNVRRKTKQINHGYRFWLVENNARGW